MGSVDLQYITCNVFLKCDQGIRILQIKLSRLEVIFLNFIALDAFFKSANTKLFISI